MKKVKTDLEASDKERQGLLEANNKLKGEVVSLTKEKETLSRLASSQDKEKEGLVASHAAREASLKAKLESLQGTLDKYGEALQEKYWKGFTNRAWSYLRTTWKKMPDLDWPLLEADAVADVEPFKKEAAAETLKAQASVAKKTRKSAVAPEGLNEAPIPAAVTSTPTEVVEDTPSDDARKAELVEEGSSPEAAKDSQAP